jgi:hypothetical protein
MLVRAFDEILSASRAQGWIMEPEAKRLLSLIHIEVPVFKWTDDVDEAAHFAGEIGYPVVAKVVSPAVVHKSEHGGVIPQVGSETELREIFSRFSRIDPFSGILVEERVSGIELIVGGKMDHQFGPVVLLGMGGTAAEIYQDISLRMAPLNEKDAESMCADLKAYPLLEGYRGSKGVNFGKLFDMMIAFSHLLMELEGQVESIDLNPVMCSPESCVVADARIILPRT